jgi:hypothetical protein
VIARFNKDSILAKIETPWKYSFVDVTFEKYADYAKKIAIRNYGKYFKVLGEYKIRNHNFEGIKVSDKKNIVPIFQKTWEGKYKQHDSSSETFRHN